MAEPLHIIHIEDSDTDAALVRRALERAGLDPRIERVEDEPVFRGALAAGGWDAIIADYHLPRFSGPAALGVLRASGLDIPFVVVSGAIGEETAAAMMKHGAHDFVSKENLARLGPAVEREVREARMRREQRTAAEQLRRSEERLALAVEATQIGTFDHDLTSGIGVWSSFARRHYGLAAEAPVTRDSLLAGVHPDDREQLENALRRAMLSSNGGRFHVEFRVAGASDGGERWLALSGRVLFDASGNPVRLAGITLDVTDRVRLEQQFRQSQKLESVGRLAGGVAHDFNNLLTVISGYAQLGMAELDRPRSLADALEEITTAAERATDLTRQLLTFSRRQFSAPKKVAINDVLRKFEKMLRRLIGEDVHLSVSLDPHAGMILTDPGQIEQVLMNLAINSKDAMPDGGTLTIETSRFTADEDFARNHLGLAPGPHVLLTVTDTGTGMSPEVMNHLFEPFFTTKEQGRGTGLGLSTVYGIVKQAHGYIAVSSRPGVGTTFRMYFPAVEPETAAAAEPEQETPAGGNETILVAEDEPGVRKYVCHVLEQCGYTVLQAANGREALRLARGFEGRIDLLLTDVVMPELGGIELAGALLEGQDGLRVLYMSGYSDRLLQAPDLAVRWVQKPFSANVLLRRIRAVLDEH